MKLCRFELKSEPGVIRSGMLYGGKIFETDGKEATATHEVSDVRPLPPLSHAASIRYFHHEFQPAALSLQNETEVKFFYGNPGTLYGPSQFIQTDLAENRVSVDPFICAVIAEPCFNLSPSEADDAILGFTLLLTLRSLTAEANDGITSGRVFDLGSTIGPVLVTTDELEDSVTGVSFGKSYRLAAALRVNGVVRFETEEAYLPTTFATAISAASRSTPLRAGDVIALGPVVDQFEDRIELEANDEVSLIADNLGVLSLKIQDLL